MRKEDKNTIIAHIADMMEPIYKKIEDAIKAVGQEGGYTYIFDFLVDRFHHISV